MAIGGNTVGIIQCKIEGARNEIGERVMSWENEASLPGWLDLMSGDSKYGNYNAKIQESTHIFVAGYTSLDKKAENKRMVIDGQIYDVLLIDDPMGLHQHIEIYLRYVGGQA